MANAKDVARQIAKCKTLEELKAFNGDNRVTVAKARDKRISELSIINEKPAPAKKETALAKKETVPAEKGEDKPKANYSKFLSKIKFDTRGTSVVKFSEAYFGKELKSAKHDKAKGIVNIVLKNGDKISTRGI